jgi:hypothetical protein
MLTRVALALCAFVTAVHGGDFRSLFNGNDLSGWDGDKRFWSARDGVIRGETTLGALPKTNTFLIWRGGAPGDFELRLKFRIQNGNSGVQYRSREIGRWTAAGYQAEIENRQGKVGFLYEEKGRKFLARVGEKVRVDDSGKPQVVGSLGDVKRDFVDRGYYREKEWNEYVITAQGNRLEHRLNGFQTIELVDDDTARRAASGLLALQIHVGPPMLVEFKDILLREP